MLNMYGGIISEQETWGFIERVNSTSSRNDAHYIPHHPVKKESAATPIRIVYDCSCKQSPNVQSLNDCLHSGPPFLNDLCAILSHFRQHGFAFSADIEKFSSMFTSMKLTETAHAFYGCQATQMSIVPLSPTGLE